MLKIGYNNIAKKRIIKMKKTTGIALGTFLLSSLCLAVEVTPQDRAKDIPSITNSELAQLMSKDSSHKLKQTTSYEDKLIKNKGKRFDYSLDRILHSIENKHNRNLRNKIFIILADKDVDIFVTQKQYNTLLKHTRIGSFLIDLNKFSKMNFSSKTIKQSGKRKIVYIKRISDNIIDEQPTPNFVLLTRANSFYANHNNVINTCKDFERAFLYFKKYKGKSSAVNNFNLSPVEVMNLYIKLARWNVDLKTVNDDLLLLFSKRAQYIKNFNFQLAFKDLKNNPSFTIATKIKQSLLKARDYKEEKATHEKFIYSEPMYLSKILQKLSKVDNSDYSIDLSYSPDIVIPLKINRIVTMKSIYDLQTYMDRATRYKIEIITNKYIKNADKKIVVIMQRDVRYQALHFLNSAIQEAKKAVNPNFSKQAFIDDIKKIKKDY